MALIETTKLTLTTETRDFLEKKVAAGIYASEDDAITEALENLRVDIEEQERWEQEVIIPRYNAFKANPSAVIPLEDVIRNLELRRTQQQKVG